MIRVEVLAPDGGPGLDPFSSALVRGAGPAAAFLPAVPRHAQGWRARAAARPAGGAADPAFAEALAARQRELGLGPAAEANARSLATAGALVVATGQQPGLLGGPLYSLHKAAGVLALARRAALALGRPVVPVFWVASEDHDWNEVNRAAVIDRAGALRTLALDFVGDRRSVRDVPVPDEAAADLLARLRDALPATERGAAAVAAATPPAGADLGTWFGVLLGRLLGDAGLVVVEPHVAAPWAGPVFVRLVEEAERVEDAVRAEGARLRAAGLPAPLDPAAGTAPLFLRDAPGGERRRVSFDGAQVFLRGERCALDRTTLAELVGREPRLASGDVVGRVLVQGAVLPVLAIVGGPTELAYWAQVRAAHEALGLPFPIACPRPQATWVDAKTAEAVAAAGLGLADALAGREPAPVEAPPDPREAAIARARAEVEAVGREGGEVAGLGRSLRDAAESLRAAEAAVRKHAEGRAGVDRDRARRATVLLRPGGSPQERVLSPVSLLARHGAEALVEGLSRLDPLATGHQVVHLP